MKKYGLGLLTACTLMSGAAYAEADKKPLELGGYVGVVSNNVFRGSALGGVAVQGSMDFTTSAVPGLGFGVWASSADTADRANGAGNETDYYIKYEKEVGKVGFGLGWMGYSFDFNRFGNEVGVENEYFFSLGYDMFSFTHYITPAQDSTKGTNEEDADTEGGPFSWTELSVSHELSDFDLGLKYETGNYVLRGDSETAAETTADVVLSVGKSVNDYASVSFNFLQMIENGDDPSLTDQFWFGFDINY